MSKTAIVCIAERCNQSCVFCLEVDGSRAEFVDPTTREVLDELGRLWARGARQITFMGGETFFRKDLGRIIERAREIGFRRVGVATNGTVLSKKGFLAGLVDAGLEYLEISIHGHTRELANEIAGTAFTFDRQAQALAELDAIGELYTIVNVVVCRENKDHLLDVARYVSESFPRIPTRFKFKFVSLQGMAAEKAAVATSLSYRDVDFVTVGDYLSSRGVQFWYYNVPLCRLGPHACRSQELATLVSDETYFDFDHQRGSGYHETGHQLQGHTWPEAPCGVCPLRPVCPGLEKRHWQVHGASELAPAGEDPVSLAAFALRDLGRDPARAAERVAALRLAPRPTSDPVPRTAVPVRFVHEAEREPVEIVVEPLRETVQAFAKTERFALSYRRWSDIDPYQRPRVAALLEHAVAELRRADGEGADIGAAKARVAALRVNGWSAQTSDAPAPGPTAKRGSLPVLRD